jgi:hypothetical protein
MKTILKEGNQIYNFILCVYEHGKLFYYGSGLSRN